MKVISGGHELKVTSTYLSDDGVVVVVRLPDKVMERLRQPDTLSARAANACLPRTGIDDGPPLPGPNDGILDEARSIRDEVRTLKQDCERIRDEVVGLRDQVSRSVTDVNAAVVKALAAADNARGCAKEAHGFERSARSNSIVAQEARDAALGAADPTPPVTFDEHGRQHADTLNREQLKQRWYKAAEERDDARQKYTEVKAELDREEERRRRTGERWRNSQCRLKKAERERDDARHDLSLSREERDKWKQRAEDTGANLRIVTAERDSGAKVRGLEANIRQLGAERDEWQRRAETAEAACRHAEINPETGEKWGTGAPLVGRTSGNPPLSAGDMSGEPVVETHPGGFDAGASTPGASPQQEVSE